MDFLGHNWLNDTPPYSDTEIKAWFETHTKVASFRGGGYADKMGNLRDVVACLSEPQREEVANAIEVSENFNPGWVQGEPHVSRLLTHSNAPACYQFALAMIRHPEYKSHVPPSLDGFEAFIFWTYGPYVLEVIDGDINAFFTKWVDKRQKSDDS